MEIIDTKMSLNEAFSIADNVLYQSVEGIAGLISGNGSINLKLADIKPFLSSTRCTVGIGNGSGKNGLNEAANMAIASPLLEYQLNKAQNVFLCITSGSYLSMKAINKVTEMVRMALEPEANLLFNAVFDKEMQQKVRITIFSLGS
jgi:cell division protein FtsZ